jgi:hypothetical protein
MQVNGRNWIHIPNAVNPLFYIKNHSDDDPILREKCQDIINLLFEKFPGVMPIPSRSLTEQSSDVVDYIARAMKG